MSVQPTLTINPRLAVAIALALRTPVSMAAPDESLEAITVTATRRAESIQDVPYNISAVTADQLAQSGVSDTFNLARLVPGLSVLNEGPRASGNRNTYILRGLNVGAGKRTSSDFMRTGRHRPRGAPRKCVRRSTNPPLANGAALSASCVRCAMR